LRFSSGSQRALDQEAVRKIHILARDHKITVVNQEGLQGRVRECKLCSGPSSIMSTRIRT
jgi:hypothetical protein